MTGLGITRPWLPLTAASADAVPAQLGVFELGDESETVTTIGYAGGREPFGMRSALAAAAREMNPDQTVLVRYELTHAYLTRFEELLMVHRARTGALPPGNRDHLHAVGRLAVD